MGAIVIIAAALCVLLLVTMLAGGPGKAHREWRKASEELGLLFDEKTLHLTGERSGFTVEAEALTGRDPYTELTVCCDAECTKEFVIGQQDRLWTNQLVNTPAYQSGDPSFDDQVGVYGDPCHLAAVLDSTTRRALVHLVCDMEGMVSEGIVRARRAGVIREAHQLVSAFRFIVRLANGLAIAEHEVPGRLSTIVRKDPIAAVRGQCISHLAARYPQSRHTKQALKIGRRDRDARVRLWAGKSAGAAGMSTIQLLVVDEQVRFELRAEGLDYLVRELPVDQAGPILAGLLGSALTIRAIAQLGRIQYRPAAKVLISRIASAEQRELLAIINAFTRMGGKGVEGSLISLLKHADEDVGDAAIVALGAVAGPVGLDELRRLSARQDTPKIVKELAQEAVIATEERLSALALVPTQEEA